MSTVFITPATCDPTPDALRVVLETDLTVQVLTHIERQAWQLAVDCAVVWRLGESYTLAARRWISSNQIVIADAA